MGKILITEQQLQTLSRTILSEQEKTVVAQEIANKLVADLNKLLKAKQDEILSTIPVKIVGKSQNDMKMTIAGEDILLPWNNKMKRPTFTLPAKRYLGIGKVNTAQFLPKLEANAQYKKLLEQHPELRKQIEDGSIKLNLSPSTRENPAVIHLGFSKMDRKGRKNIQLTLGDEFKLGDLLRNNQLWLKMNKKIAAKLATGNLSWDLGDANIKLGSIGKIEKPATLPTGPPLNFNTGENFILNQATLRPEAIRQIQNQIINQINQLGTNLPDYITRLEANPIVITAFASRDADPDGTNYNTGAARGNLFQPCVDRNTLGEYNQCLSAARARAIVTHLQTTAPNIFGGNVTFRAVGGGENVSNNSWRIRQRRP